MAYFPLFVDLEGKEVLVAGGGRIANRRILVLLEFGCRITVVSPELTLELESLAAAGRIEVLRIRMQDFAGREPAAAVSPFLVLTATGDKEADRCAGEWAKKWGALFNHAGNQEESQFYFPGVVRKGNLVIGVTASGEDHHLARRMTERIRSMTETGEAGKENKGRI